MRNKLTTDYLIIFLLIIVQHVTCQTKNSINLEFGSIILDFKIKETTNYSMSSWGSSLSFYSTLTNETQLKSHDFISLKY